MLACALVSCGGDDDDDDDDAGSDDGVAGIDESVDDLLGSIADAFGDVAADTEDGPGTVRFVNLLESDGAGVDVDVWWGRPEDGQQATSITYGQASDYLTPRQSKAFDEASWTMTPAGGDEQLTGFSFTPQEDTQQTFIVFSSEDGTSMMPVEEILEFSPEDGMWGFQPPDSGQVRVKWVVITGVLEAPNGGFRNAGTGTGECLTNGTGINAEDDLSTRSTTFQVPGGAVVNLYDDFPTCSGPTSATATAPDGGRALLIAYVDASETPQLLMLPVLG